MELRGTIDSHIEIPPNSVAKITGNLEIGPAGSLTVREGAMILVDEALILIWAVRWFLQARRRIRYSYMQQKKQVLGRIYHKGSCRHN